MLETPFPKRCGNLQLPALGPCNAPASLQLVREREQHHHHPRRHGRRAISVILDLRGLRTVARLSVVQKSSEQREWETKPKTMVAQLAVNKGNGTAGRHIYMRGAEIVAALLQKTTLELRMYTEPFASKGLQEDW